MSTEENRDKEYKKVVVAGLDGVPYTLLLEYMERGVMPELKELCRGGKLIRMSSSLPEVSSVAWTGFMTGRNPGEHGIFGFMELDRQSYGYTFPNFTTLKERPVWERNNIKTVAFNIPQTYPALPMNGVMVSGFVALDLKKATYPDRVFSYLSERGYRLDVDARLAGENPEAFFADLFEVFRKRREAIEYLYDNEEWQLFIGTITETDRLHHFFYDSAREGQYFAVFERFYRELDGFIGNLARKAERDGALFMTCSDHGFTPISTEVYLNRWLVESGYLERDGGEGLKGMTSSSRAFCLDPSRIYLHLEGKYKKGRVQQKEYRSLLDELKGQFLEIAFEGRKVIKEAYRREEIFHGRYAENGPDLYLLPHYGFDLKGSVDRSSVFGTSRFRGMHTYDDAHLFVSDGALVQEDEQWSIERVLTGAHYTLNTAA
ncbi:MAG: alkaline phosphatase family protein [Alphaproteobacteria bacterium]|uniref:Alkaline phosphatase family protein n=1 Tax=Candidatus Nitrobium versatile TaxID=2884831 RepID=A0A953JEH6_9BACT|nr:alkaline phosphatase family protein [Candidatus Nitrobium versatile]